MLQVVSTRKPLTVGGVLSSKEYSLNSIVTDETNHVIFPESEYLRGYGTLKYGDVHE